MNIFVLAFAYPMKRILYVVECSSCFNRSIFLTKTAPIGTLSLMLMNPSIYRGFLFSIESANATAAHWMFASHSLWICDAVFRRI